MTDPITLTNPATGESWTSGKRGRKPKWVMELEAAGTMIPKKVINGVKVKSTVPAVTGALRVWKYVGQAGESGDNDEHQKTARCLIIASNESDAIRVSTPCFQFPLSGSELAGMWSEIKDTDLVADLHASGIDVTKHGVWHSKDGKWALRAKRT